VSRLCKEPSNDLARKIAMRDCRLFASDGGGIPGVDGHDKCAVEYSRRYSSVARAVQHASH